MLFDKVLWSGASFLQEQDKSERCVRWSFDCVGANMGASLEHDEIVFFDRISLEGLLSYGNGMDHVRFQWVDSPCHPLYI